MFIKENKKNNRNNKKILTEEQTFSYKCLNVIQFLTSKTVFHLLLKIVVISLILYLSYTNTINKQINSTIRNNKNSNKNSNNANINNQKKIETQKNLIISIISIILVFVIYLSKNKKLYQDDLLLIFILIIINLLNYRKQHELFEYFTNNDINYVFTINENKELMIDLDKLDLPDKEQLVHGSSKPEHYDYTPDDLPSFQLSKMLSKFKDKHKNDKNREYNEKVEPYNKSYLKEINPNYNPLNKLKYSIKSENDYIKLNNTIINTLNDYYENENLFKDKNHIQNLKSIDNLVPFTKYRKTNGTGNSKYEQICKDDVDSNKISKNVEKFLPSPFVDSYSLLSDNKRPNLINLDKQSFYDQYCTNYPKVNEENLQLINDNSARDINNNLPKKSFVAFTQNQFDIGNGNIINLNNINN